jgi:hypothetical protein
MDTKRYLIAVIVVFVVYSGVAYPIHQVLLQPDYDALQEKQEKPVRSFAEFTKRVPLLYLANLIFSLAFCFIYIRGYEPNKHWLRQGVRYGLVVATLLAPMALIGYVALPIPLLLALKLIVLNYVHLVITALVAAGVYQTPPLPLPA